MLVAGPAVKSRDDNDGLPWSQGPLLPSCDAHVYTRYHASQSMNQDSGVRLQGH